MSYQAHKALAGIDLFADLPDSILRDLVGRGSTYEATPGREVVSQGSANAGLEVVLDGTADVTVNGEHRLTLHPGDYFGEISLIDRGPRSASIVAGPDGLTTFRLSALAFAPMLDDPHVSRTLLKALCARLRSMETPESPEN